MKLKIFDDYNTMSAAAADQIIEIVNSKPDAVLCFATGNTPVLTYELLAKKANQNKIDFSKCFFIGLDEWLGIPPEKSGSCHYTLYQQLFSPLHITDSQIHLFDAMTTDIAKECSKMNKVIIQHGGIDCMLVGVGINGHIGFNEPGIDINAEAHQQELHATTLASGKHYFNEPTQIQKGITLGMAQVMKAEILLLLANGKTKAAIMKEVLEAGVTNKVPASYVQEHTNAIVMIDKEASSDLK